MEDGPPCRAGVAAPRSVPGAMEGASSRWIPAWRPRPAGKPCIEHRFRIAFPVTVPFTWKWRSRIGSDAPRVGAVPAIPQKPTPETTRGPAAAEATARISSKRVKFGKPAIRESPQDDRGALTCLGCCADRPKPVSVCPDGEYPLGSHSPGRTHVRWFEIPPLIRPPRYRMRSAAPHATCAHAVAASTCI